MIDQAAPASWANTSTVVTSGATCPAPQQDGQCKDCRNCWNKEIKNISYGQHWWNLNTQNIIKNYASYVIIWIRSLAKNRRRLGISVHLVRASSDKLQAPSSKPQATLNQNLVQVLQIIYRSIKPQAASIKLQAASYKLHDPGTWVQVNKFRGPWTKGLDHDKSILWMCYVEGNLVWRKADLVPLRDF